jgi:hypothetical protein
MQACAAGYALTYAITLKVQLVVGLTAANFCLLYFLCVVSPYPVPYTFGFTWFRITSACALPNLVM